MAIFDLLRQPESRSVTDLDDPDATAQHGRIIRRKRFLRELYADFYRRMLAWLPAPAPRVVELGSGGGFLRELLPTAITSDVLPVPGIDVRLSAERMPFRDGAVDAFVLTDVMHHLPDVSSFLSELERCLRPGGRAMMIEPASTLASRFIFNYLHHEPFSPEADWSFPRGGPLSAANVALPWIVLVRDRGRFERERPGLTLRLLDPHTPLRYLLSGGVSWRQLAPDWAYPLAVRCERLLSPLDDHLGMFYTIVLERR